MSEQNILLVQSSARHAGSVTRELAEALALKLGGTVKTRDLAQGVRLVDENWVEANFTDADARSSAQADVLAGSDELVRELFEAQSVVIAAPIYNFSIPAALKAWIDQIARAKLTFQYTEEGPVGLLGGRKAYIVVSSGGVPVGSAADFATPYLRHVLGFVGIDDIEIIDASAQMIRGAAALAGAHAQVEELARKTAA